MGWHLTGGDARPAHFLGVHANQFIPLAGLALVYLQKKWVSQTVAISVLYAVVILYVLMWSGLSLLGLSPSP